MPASKDPVARLLERWQGGDRQAIDELVDELYGELHRLAGFHMRRERTDHTLQATAIVHEVYLRLADGPAPRVISRPHFLGIAARVMRQVLVDYSRQRGRVKRGGGLQRVTLGAAASSMECRPAELIALDDALAGLAVEDRRKAAIVELRYFGGLTLDEIAEVLEVAPRTVSREWRRARAWLLCELTEAPAATARADSAR